MDGDILLLLVVGRHQAEQRHGAVGIGIGLADQIAGGAAADQQLFALPVGREADGQPVDAADLGGGALQRIRRAQYGAEMIAQPVAQRHAAGQTECLVGGESGRLQRQRAAVANDQLQRPSARQFDLHPPLGGQAHALRRRVGQAMSEPAVQRGRHLADRPEGAAG